MPSLFSVCFGTAVFLCLLFSTQNDFEAKATKKKYRCWALLRKGDYTFAQGMLLPVQDSWLVLAAALTFMVVGGHEGRHCSHPNELRLMPTVTTLFSTLVKPAHVPALNCPLKRSLFFSPLAVP